MIKQIEFIHYRKFKRNDVITFIPGINVISGTNGTCKTSILHLISNSYQKVAIKDVRMKSPKNVTMFNKLSKGLNLKIEALTKGDQLYADPAIGTKGTLFKVSYYGDIKELAFRRHNSKEKHRFSIKPSYVKGSKDTLPFAPVIFLGLSRLFPYGEYSENKDPQKESKVKIDDILSDIKKDFDAQYKECVGLEIDSQDTLVVEAMTGIRERDLFSTKHEGIDSNTISSGQDSVYVILRALANLRYYYESVLEDCRRDSIESVLLIDEFDATLHPEIQIKLFNCIKDYSEKYKIQVIFTTHSLSLIEQLIKRKDVNINYLINEIDRVHIDPSISMDQIHMHLKNVLRKDILRDDKILVYSEDEQARLFIQEIFKYYIDQKSDRKISLAIGLFELVEVSISADVLKPIFSISGPGSLSRTSIAILDGDQHINNKDHTANQYTANNIIVLPAIDKVDAKKNTPEYILAAFSIKIFNDSGAHNDFWRSEELLYEGYSLEYFKEHIKSDLERILNLDQEVAKMREAGQSAKGYIRQVSKDIFNKHKEFLTYSLKYWITREENSDAIKQFMTGVNIAFHKLQYFHNLPTSYWKTI